MTPSICRLVVYRLTLEDAEQINRQRQHARDHMAMHRNSKTGVQVHVGTQVKQGDEFPMLITRVWGDRPGALINGMVFADGTDAFWVQSKAEGEAEGEWHWPARVPAETGGGTTGEAGRAGMTTSANLRTKEFVPQEMGS